VLVAYTDGCVDACVRGAGPSTSHVSMVMRQSSGPLLYAKGRYDRR
jgi:hypothetical protein